MESETKAIQEALGCSETYVVLNVTAETDSLSLKNILHEVWKVPRGTPYTAKWVQLNPLLAKLYCLSKKSYYQFKYKYSLEPTLCCSTSSRVGSNSLSGREFESRQLHILFYYILICSIWIWISLYLRPNFAEYHLYGRPNWQTMYRKYHKKLANHIKYDSKML